MHEVDASSIMHCPTEVHLMVKKRPEKLSANQTQPMKKSMVFINLMVTLVLQKKIFFVNKSTSIAINRNACKNFSEFNEEVNWPSVRNNRARRGVTVGTRAWLTLNGNDSYKTRNPHVDL